MGTGLNVVHCPNTCGALRRVLTLTPLSNKSRFDSSKFAKGISRWKTGLSWHFGRGQNGEKTYGKPLRKLRVTPLLRIECKFWLTDDGWNGSCEQPSITVQAGSFEHARSEMELALGKYVESLLRETQGTSTGQAA